MVYNPDSSGSTFGWTFYPAIMLVILGFLQIFTGLFGVIGNEVYVATEEYPLQLDSVTWGWIHLVVGALAMVVGFGLFAGRMWARTLGVIIAVVSALATFVWLPQFPLWGFAILAVNLLVIWALTVHGGDLVDET